MNDRAVASCIQRQEFDSTVFGRPFYRIVSFDRARLERELPPVMAMPSAIVDAKLPSGDIEQAAFLMRHGFRKVCMQVELVNPLREAVSANRASILARLDLPPDALRAHVRHFTADRFALDVMLPRDGHDRLYETWISNSLSGARHRVAASGVNFVTFRDDGDDVKIDLTSILDKGRGLGTDLINAVLRDARERGKRAVAVVTECENVAAVGLYRKNGFVISRFVSALHFVRD